MLSKPSSASSLTEWLDWLIQLHAQEIDLGLARVSEVANRLAVLKPAPVVITVAGTNGKGSSVALLVAILTAAGYRVGSYTSPHLLYFNERIQINAQPVGDQAIRDAFAAIEEKRKSTKLTYFEFATLAALSIFSRANLDVVVLEVGLGGRLDAVNIVDADATLITAIDVDHIEWLGSDREQIGFEKAGVMRTGQLSVCSDRSPPLRLLQHATALNVELACLGRDFEFEREVLNSNQTWCFVAKERIDNLPMPALLGDFQLQNAAGVLALLIKQPLLKLDRQAIEIGLKNVKHPGRLQKVQLNHQAWLLDVAHNPQSAKALADYLAQQPLVTKRLVIFAALNDKDQASMVKAIVPFVSEWLLVDLGGARSTPLVDLQAVLRLCGINDEQMRTMDTMQHAVSWAKKQDINQVLVYGSFITVAQALEELAWTN